jgi:phage shock protein PspC (stress-responsive transcriptional regulator)
MRGNSCLVLNMARETGNRPKTVGKKKSVSKHKPIANRAGGARRSKKPSKILYRSASNRVFLGVLGGIAEYFNADPAHVRLLWIAVIVVVGLAAGLVAYTVVPTALTILLVLYVIAYLLMNETPAK